MPLNEQEVNNALYKERVLYNGEITLKFVKNGHKYLVNGKRVKGVTTYIGILDKPALVYWAVNCMADYLTERRQELQSLDSIRFQEMIAEAKKAHKREVDTAANIGTEVHEWIEAWTEADIRRREQTDVTYHQMKPMGRAKYNYPILPQHEEVLNSVKAFLKWVEDKKPVFEKSEQIIYSKKNDCGGMIDARAVINGKRYPIDYKTSGIWDSYAIQLAGGYRAFEEEETGKDSYDGCLIVRLPKDGEQYEEKYFAEDKEEYENLKKMFQACVYLYPRLQVLRKQFT